MEFRSFCFEIRLINVTYFSHEQYQTKGNHPSKGWSNENGYENNFDTNVYPLRGVATNKEHELKLRLQFNLNDLVNVFDDVNLMSNGFIVSKNLIVLLLLFKFFYPRTVEDHPDHTRKALSLVVFV